MQRILFLQRIDEHEINKKSYLLYIVFLKTLKNSQMCMTIYLQKLYPFQNNKIELPHFEKKTPPNFVTRILIFGSMMK